MFQFESQGAVEVVTPEVAINHENAERFKESIAERPFVGQPMVVIDMRHVALLDSAALDALLDVQRLVRELSGSIKLASMSPLCKDIFKITGLTERFETHDDTKSAVGSFVR